MGERQAEAEGEAGSPRTREPAAGLGPRTLGSHPGPQTDAQPLSSPGAPPPPSIRALNAPAQSLHLLCVRWEASLTVTHTEGDTWAHMEVVFQFSSLMAGARMDFVTGQPGRVWGLGESDLSLVTRTRGGWIGTQT